MARADLHAFWRVAKHVCISEFLCRLVLIGAVLCARLVAYVTFALHIEVPVCCWTDSTFTLFWNKGDPF